MAQVAIENLIRRRAAAFVNYNGEELVSGIVIEVRTVKGRKGPYEVVKILNNEPRFPEDFLTILKSAVLFEEPPNPQEPV